MRKNKKPNNCMDCGKSICRTSTRCQSCAAKKQFQDPEQRWKAGFSWRGKKHTKEYKKKMSQKMTTVDKSILTKKFLCQEYIVKKKSYLLIAKETGICKTTVGEYLKKLGISKRKEVAKKLTKKFLIREYVKNKKSTCQIAKEIGMRYSTVFDFLKKHNIPTRTKSEAQIGREYSDETRKRISLGNGGTGISYEDRDYPAEFYAIREYIRERDNHVCQVCGVLEDDYYRALDVHHIDYDKKNCKEINLVSLCEGCHAKTNPKNKRKFWMEYFSQKVRNF